MVRIAKNMEESNYRPRDTIYELSRDILGLGLIEMMRLQLDNLKKCTNFIKNSMLITNKVIEFYKSAKNCVQTKFLEINQMWWEQKALKESVDSGLYENLKNLKEIFGSRNEGCSPFFSTDGNRPTDHNDILKRWAKHSKDVFIKMQTRACSQSIISSQRSVMDSLALYLRLGGILGEI